MTEFKTFSVHPYIRCFLGLISKDKYPSIFSPQMEAIVFLILQIFFAARAVLKIGEYLKGLGRAILGNRPFAGSGEMVRNKLHWDANDAVGLSKQRKVTLNW